MSSGRQNAKGGMMSLKPEYEWASVAMHTVEPSPPLPFGKESPIRGISPGEIAPYDFAGGVQSIQFIDGGDGKTLVGSHPDRKKAVIMFVLKGSASVTVSSYDGDERKIEISEGMTSRGLLVRPRTDYSVRPHEGALLVMMFSAPIEASDDD